MSQTLRDKELELETVTVLSLLAFVKKLVDMIKYFTNRQVNAIVTQVVAWVAAIGVLAVAANADITAALQVFGDFRLGDLDFGSMVLGGLLVGSTASVVLHDVPAAIDNKDTAYTPALLPAQAAKVPLRT